jgi:phosphate:Na+ symporter
MTLALLNLAGTVALLLWGVHMVSTGFQRAYGARLRSLLGRALRNRFQAFVAGFGITIVLQSSTATSLMVTGFSAGGLIDLVPALAVMLGANVGSTVVVQVLSFDITAAAPAFVLLGLILFRRGQAAMHDFGRVFIGLGLVLIALHQFLTSLASIESSSLFLAIAKDIADQPLIAVVLAAIATWALHSSVATILIVMSLASKGLVSADAAIFFVIGANIGTAVNAVVEGTSAASVDTAARRLPVGNLALRVLGGGVALIAAPWISSLLPPGGPNLAHSIANVHTLFNLVLAVVALPLLTPYAKLLRILLPTTIRATDPGTPQYLDASARDAPIVALGAAAREALRLADFVEAMLQGLKDVLEKRDRRLISDTRRLDDSVDRINSAIKAYVTAIDQDALSEADHRRLNQILAFSLNMEQAADVIDNNLLSLAAKAIKRGVAFSDEGLDELVVMLDRLIGNTRTAASLFISDDVRAARLMARQKQEFRKFESDAVARHFQRLRAGRRDTVETSALHLDAVRDLKQVNAHLVAAAAYPVLEGHGELLPSRIRDVRSG